MKTFLDWISNNVGASFILLIAILIVLYWVKDFLENRFYIKNGYIQEETIVDDGFGRNKKSLKWVKPPSSKK